MALNDVLDDFPMTFTKAMNDTLTQEITHRELRATFRTLTKGKAPGHDGIPIKFFQQLWSTINEDFHQMIVKEIKHKGFPKGVTKRATLSPGEL